jgi:autotransporter-associated beta strand protein
MQTYDSPFPRNEEWKSAAKRRSLRLAAIGIFACILFGMPQAAHCAIVSYLGSGDLDDKKSWSTQNVPTASDEAVFNIGNSTISSTGGLNFGDIVWNNNTSAAISLKATGITRFLTLSGVPGGTAITLAGGSSGDLLLMGRNATTNTLKFEAVPGNAELQFRLVVDGNFNVLNPGATLDISTAITGAKSLAKTGNGTLVLGSANTYSGTTTVKSGTLKAKAANSLGATGAINVQGGSLLIGASDAVNDQANITLGNARLQMSGTNITERLGALTLTGNSVIDVKELQGTNNALHFASSFLQQGWAQDTSLAIWNWDFSGENRIYFGSDSNGLSPSQLQQISFYSDFGNTFIGNAFISNTGEITTVPEAEAVFVAALLLLSVLAHSAMARRGTGLSRRGAGSFLLKF